MQRSNTSNLMMMITEMQPLEFAGLAKLLGAQLIKEKDPEAQDPKDRYEPCSFTEVFEDVLARFNKLNRKRKREILKLIQKSNSMHRGEHNASNPIDTKSRDINEEM